MSIVVTGATGHLGRLIVDELLERVAPEDVVVVSRSPERAAGFAQRGLEVRIADYDDPGSLTALIGAGDTVLLTSLPASEIGRRVAAHTAVVDAARDAQAARLVYTSSLGGPKAQFALAAEHKPVEEAIRVSGLPFTFLRFGWYTENHTALVARQLEHGVVGSAGDGRVASAARADFAAAAAVVLTGDDHDGTAYELCGDTAWSLREYAAELSAQSGRTVEYREVPPPVLRGILVGAGLPEALADTLVDTDVNAIGAGLLAGGSDDLRRLIGRPTTPLAASIAAALRGLAA